MSQVRLLHQTPGRKAQREKIPQTLKRSPTEWPEGGGRCLAGPGGTGSCRDLSRREPRRQWLRDDGAEEGLAKCRARRRRPIAEPDRIPGSTARLPCSPRIPHRLDRRRPDLTGPVEGGEECVATGYRRGGRANVGSAGAQTGLRSRRCGRSTPASGRLYPLRLSVGGRLAIVNQWE